MGLFGYTPVDSSGMVGLRGVPGTPFSPCQDSGERKDLGRLCLDCLLTWDSLQSSGLSTVPGDLKDVQRRQGNSDGKLGHHSKIE